MLPNSVSNLGIISWVALHNIYTFFVHLRGVAKYKIIVHYPGFQPMTI